jgi:hydrogenase maturation protease
MRTLIYGYGNPGRQDDALGVSFVEELEKWAVLKGLKNIEFDTNYQLNIEDSETISDKDLVIFADATIEPIENFIYTQVQPDETKIEFSMHAVSTSYILALCQKIYNKNPETWLMHIKGYEWEFQEGITKEAQVNLEKALEFIKDELMLRIGK